MIATLKNLDVVITGGLSKMTRAKAYDLIRAEGGFPRKKVSRNTDVLIITNELNFSGYVFHKTEKIRKAEELDTEIMTEAEFYEIIGV